MYVNSYHRNLDLHIFSDSEVDYFLELCYIHTKNEQFIVEF